MLKVQALHDHIKSLAVNEEWAALRLLSAALPEGEPLARVHLVLSRHYAENARHVVYLWKALKHAQEALRTSEPDGLLHTWAWGRVAILLNDLGDFRSAIKAGDLYAIELASHPGAAPIAPWVWTAVGRAYDSIGRYRVAEELYQRSLATGGDEELQEQTRLYLAQTYARSRRIAAARLICPSAVSPASEGLSAATQAIIAACAGDWGESRQCAREAVAAHARGTWRFYDTLDVAAVLLVLQRAEDALRLHKTAHLWGISASIFLAGWYEGVTDDLVATLPAKGGEWIDEAASRCTPSGCKRCGLLGAVG